MSDPIPVLSVVIPMFNGAETIDAQLAALADQKFDRPWELVVADNGSTDDSAERVRRWQDRLPVRVVDASQARGVSHARNAGIRASRAPVWVCCDADDVIDPGWLAAMADALDKHQLVTGALDNRSLNPDDSLRVARDTTDIIAYAKFLPYGYGANMGATRELFDEIGGFDTQYTHGGDDVDFSWRAQLAGAELHFVPEAVVQYRHRDSARATWRQLHSYARAQPKLYKRFRSDGMPRSDTRLAVKQWLWLLLRLPTIVRPGPHRRSWLRVSAKRLGYLRGSWDNRVLYL